MEQGQIALPSGGWYTAVDVETLTAKDRKKVLEAGSGLTAEKKMIALAESMMAILITSWSFEAPMPSLKLSSLDNLSPKDYTFLENAAGEIETYLFPQITETLESRTDPEVPIANS